MPSEFFDVVTPTPWAVITAIVSWFGAMYVYRDKKKGAKIEQNDRLEIHRDELTLSIVQLGREEIAAARLEVDDLRSEVRKLRALEVHFYHFQQSLDHLEALLTATTEQEHVDAERNARAFLNRMRRLADAKGTVANEAQRAASEVELLDRANRLGKDKKDGGSTSSGAA